MEGLQDGGDNTVEELIETERVIGLVMKAIEDDVRQMARALVSRRDDELLGPGEFDLRDRVLKAGCHILEAAINDRKKGGTKAAARLVLNAGKAARFVEWRGKKVVSLVGDIKVQFAYYHCSHCGCGYQPWCEQLHLGKITLTPAANEISSLAGILGSFADGAERVLRKMSGLRLSESTIERTTEAAGERVAAQLEAGQALGPTEAWNWQKDARGKSCAYVSLDATGVRQQGPGGTRVDGKMAYVAMVYNANSEHDPTRPPPRQVRYLSGFYDFQTLGRQLHREVLEVGWTAAGQQIAISDGGNGLEDFFHTYFPKAECILDFWHAKEYLVELGKAIYSHDEAGRQKWTDEVCHRLKHEGGPTVRRWLETLGLSSTAADVREVHRRTTQYFCNHEHRMDYPRYLANGWQIGSGPVESACKTVVGNRLKGGGMRWGKAGADGVCHLRGLYLSEPACWESFWNPA